MIDVGSIDLSRLWLWIELCSGQAISTPACYGLWLVVAVLLAIVGFVLVAVVIWSMIDYRRKWKAALQADERRQAIASEELMQQYRWSGDDHYDG